MTTSKSKYRASFTAGALLLSEFRSIAHLIGCEDLVDQLNKEVQENSYLRLKTELARARVVTEMKRRLKFTPSEYWNGFSSWNEQEQKLFLFYLIMNAHPLVKDLQFEAVVQRWKMLITDISKQDLQLRLQEIESWDDEVSSWSDSTKTKVLTQMIRILTEAGLLQKGRLTKPLSYNDDFWKQFIQWDAAWFLEACLLSPKEIEALK